MLCTWLLTSCRTQRAEQPLQAELTPLPHVAGHEYVSLVGASPLAFVQIRLHFTEDHFSFVAECNRLSGSYRLHGDQLLVAELSSVQTPCLGPQQLDDVWLRKFLLARPMLTAQAELLAFHGHGSKLVFMERAAAERDRPLVGTEWTVETYMDGEGALALNVQEPRLVFAADGTWSLAACSAAHGRFVRTLEGALLLSDVQFEQAVCRGETEPVAARFLREVLRPGAVNVRIEAGSLWLERAGTSLGLRIRR